MREYVSLFFVGFFISSIVLAKSSTPLFEYNGRKIYYKDLSNIRFQSFLTSPKDDGYFLQRV